MTGSTETPAIRRKPGPVWRLWLGRLLWACGLSVGAVLAFAYLWPATRGFESSEWRAVSFFVFAVRTLVFHIALGFAALALCALLVRARRLAICCGLVAMGVLAPLASTYLRVDHGPGDSPMLTVYSANVYVGRADPHEIAAQVRAHDADVVLIQEATPGFAQRLRTELAGEYPFIEEASRNGAYGQFTLSRLALVGGSDHYPQGSLADEFEMRPGINAADPQIRVVVEFDGREIVIQNIHLTSPGGVGAVAEQLEQARWLAGWIGDEPRPLMMMGDFNCTPTSAHAGMLRRAGWRDAFASVGRGRGATWPARTRLAHLPGVRIDHAYSGHGLVAVSAEVLEAHGLDHRPTVARFVLE